MKRMKKEGEYDRVIAFIFPPSVYLHAKKGLVDHRWIFDLQESVTPQYKIVPRRSKIQKLRMPALIRLEQKALHQAGCVVFTATTNQKAYIDNGLVPEHKTRHIPYFYDSEVFDHSETETPNGFEIRYFGTFDWRGSRSPRVFLQSLARFLEQHKEAREVTSFTFYGTWLAEHNSMIEELGLTDVVDIKEGVPYDEYLEKVRSAPVLLLVVSAEHNLFMPSKIVDYFGAARPILAFLPKAVSIPQIMM